MSHNLNLEVYEFLLKDYPFNLASSGIYNSIPDINVRTLSIESSDIDECGIVANEVKQDAIDEATTLPKDIFNPKREGDFINHNNIRSCDPIKSSTITNTHPISLNVDKEDAYKYSFNILGINSRDLIFYSSIYGAKNTGIDASIYDEKIVMDQKNDSGQLVIEAYFPSMIILYNDIKKKIIEDVKPILEQDWFSESIDVRTIKDTHEKYEILNNHTLIKKINPSIDNKFVVIGDIHGSYATFIRILLRFRKMNIMNEECILQNNYHIIFLGDIVDRGQYAYEIIMLIFLLKIKNPSCIHINRGNHEEENMNERDGFLNELISKFGRSEGTQMHIRLNNVFLHQHSAILIKNPINDKYTYLAHGGLPIATYTLNILPSFKNFNNLNNIIIENKDISKNTANTIRWNDFWGYQNSIYTNERAIKLGQDIINKVNNPEINIELIIRAHQDRFFNTKLLLKKDEESQELLEDTFININNLQAIGIANPDLNQKIHCYKFTHLITVNQTGLLDINHNSYSDLLPVITISTNTDKGRDLAKDSFVILKYFEDFNPALDGCAIVDSDEEKLIKKNRFMTKYPSEIDKIKSELAVFRSKGDFKSPEYNNKVIENDKLTAKFREYTTRFRGGNYYDKYMKYKAKYLDLKKLSI